MNIDTKSHNIKRAFLVTDTHFGVRNNSVEWMDIQKDYFYNFLIPLIKKELRDGDVLIHLGDVFDSRQAINLRVLDLSMEIFETISKILPVHMICGNHDIYQKKSNKINSLSVFKWLPNIHIYTDPVVIHTPSKNKLLLLPWQDDNLIEKEIVLNANAHFAFCHTDVQNLKLNHKTLIEHGNEPELYKSYKSMYTGHIHLTQVLGNIRVLGSPYQITRSDSGDIKGVWLVDFGDEKETFFENTVSPKFIKIKLSNLLTYRFSDIKRIFHNNFIDVLITSDDAVNFPFSKLLDVLVNIKYRKLNYIVVTNEQMEDYEDSDYEEFDLLGLTNAYIDDLKYNDSIKTKMKDYVSVLFERFMKAEIEAI